MPTFGPFNRSESRTQTIQDAIDQVKSQEIWGTTRNNGIEPAVKAYAGNLKPNERGIEFETQIRPYPDGSPLEAAWYLTKTPGVILRVKNGIDYACIPASVRNLQP